MSKYYTPEIEEFHYGFEFEVNYTAGGWSTEIFGVGPKSINSIPKLTGSFLNGMPLEGNIRVKYLDKEDIESEGFIGQKANSVYFKRDGWRLVHWMAEPIRRTLVFKVFADGDEEKVFVGTVRNKSELKKLLKQLNIE